MQISIPNSISNNGMYQCIHCGLWVGMMEVHNCYARNPSPTTFISPPITFPFITGSIMKHINWQEYTAARPPEAGEYIVIYKDLKTGQKEWCFSTFDIDKYTWTEVADCAGSELWVVTHYAKLDLP